MNHVTIARKLVDRLPCAQRNGRKTFKATFRGSVLNITFTWVDCAMILAANVVT